MTRIALAALAATALCVGSASADSYPDGYVNDAGYTWRNGYWWKDSHAYKYEKYWVPGSCYFYGGYYHQDPGHWDHKYVEYPVANYVPPVQKVTYRDADWKAKLLDIAAARDKWEGDIRRGAYEQRYFMDSVDALGLKGNFHWGGYGASPPYGDVTAYPLNGVLRSSLQFGSYGANASTIYGSSYKQIAEQYGDANLSQLYQQANRLAENAQKLGGQATADFSGLVQAEGSNRARVAEILARGEAAQRVLQSLDGPPRTETRTLEFKIGGASQAASGPKQQFESVFSTRCGACHSGAKPKAGFDLTKYYGMTPEQKGQVWELLVTKDRDKMMPRSRDGAAAEYLPLAEVKLFTEN